MEGKEPKEPIYVFIVRCPQGDCSKKGSILAKKLTEEDARKAVSWHLQASPYHEFSKTESDLIAATCDVEVKEGDPEVWALQQNEEVENWYQVRKKHKGSGNRGNPIGSRGKGAIGTIAPFDRGAIGAISDSGGSSHGQTVVVRGGAASHVQPQQVLISKIQLQACVDSLKRAHTAADSAGHLCSKASRAFFEEAACISNCKAVLESYLVE